MTDDFPCCTTAPEELRRRAAFERRDRAYGRWEWLLAGVVLGTVVTAALTAVVC